MPAATLRGGDWWLVSNCRPSPSGARAMRRITMRKLVVVAGLTAASLGLGIPAALAHGNPPAPPGSEAGKGPAYGKCVGTASSSGLVPKPGTLDGCPSPVGLQPG